MVRIAEVPVSRQWSAAAHHALGGGPLLLSGGREAVSPMRVGGDGGPVPDITGRNPRTAVCTADLEAARFRLLLVTVDGDRRRREASGITISELTETMKRLGACNITTL